MTWIEKNKTVGKVESGCENKPSMGLSAQILIDTQV